MAPVLVKLVWPVLFGAAVGACLFAVYLLTAQVLVDWVAAITSSQSPATQFSATLIAASAGLALGYSLFGPLRRYLHTRIDMPSLLTNADRSITCAIAIFASVGVLGTWYAAAPAVDWSLLVGGQTLLIFCGASAFSVLIRTIGRIVLSSNDPPLGRTDSPLPWVYDDSPRLVESDDLLHREGLVALMMSVLRDRASQRASTVIALNGEWGAGKTTILKTLRDRLNHSGDFLVAWFDPWHFDSPPTLLRGFFQSVVRAISDRYLIPDAGYLANRYLAVFTPSFVKFGFTLDPLKQPEVEATRSAINALTFKVKPHIVVVIDDLDRLREDELLLVLQLLKLSTNFQNVTYLLALDREFVEKRITDAGGAAYLKKIIDIDISIDTMLDQADLDSYFLTEVERIITAAKLTKLRGINELTKSYRQSGHSTIRTIRDAKRVLTSFSIAMSLLPGEVNVCDVLLLEMIRYLSLTAWKRVAEGPQYFVDWKMERGVPKNEMEEYHNQVVAMADPDRQALLRSLLVEVFPRVGASAVAGVPLDPMAEARAREAFYFPRYFMYRLAASMVPLRVLDALVAKVNSDDPSTFDHELGLVLQEFGAARMQVFDRLIPMADEIQPDRRRSVIAAVAHLSKLYSTERLTMALADEADRARALVFVLATHFQGTSEIQEILESVIRESQTLVFAADFVHFSQRNVNGIIGDWRFVDHDRLQQVLNERIESDLLHSGRDILTEAGPRFWEWYRVLHHWTNRNAKATYLEELAATRPTAISEIIESYRATTFSGVGTGDVKFDELEADWDIHHIVELVDKLGEDKVSQNEIAGAAVRALKERAAAAAESRIDPA